MSTFLYTINGDNIEKDGVAIATLPENGSREEFERLAGFGNGYFADEKLLNTVLDLIAGRDQ